MIHSTLFNINVRVELNFIELKDGGGGGWATSKKNYYCFQKLKFDFHSFKKLLFLFHKTISLRSYREYKSGLVKSRQCRVPSYCPTLVRPADSNDELKVRR